MALNHEVHISIIFFFSFFFPNPQSRTPNLDHSALVPPFFSSNGKGEGKGHVNISTSIYPSSNVTILTCFVDTRWVTGTSRNL